MPRLKLIRRFIPRKYLYVFKKFYYKLNALIYSGNKYFCPCCDRGFRKFLPTYMHKPEPRRRCPGCGSLERHRLLWLYLKNKTNFFSENLKVLHFAPEFPFLKLFRDTPNLDYISADLCSPLAMVKMDICNIPYEDNTFDAILCLHVLQYINDDRKAMKEMLRVLKPGGWGILMVPIDLIRDKTIEYDGIPLSDDPESRDFSHNDFVRWYGIDYKERLVEAGFEVIIDGYVRELGGCTDKIKKYVLRESEDIYFCLKPLR